MCAGQDMPTREWTACWTDICALAGIDKGTDRDKDGPVFGTQKVSWPARVQGLVRKRNTHSAMVSVGWSVRAFGFGSVQVWLRDE